ncbi:MAG TPA: hypothetical protein VEW93_06905 [Acidimicrobiales bacterium]|nr:hypothetical protein [Acidimicrobiales bacterium]
MSAGKSARAWPVAILFVVALVAATVFNGDSSESKAQADVADSQTSTSTTTSSDSLPTSTTTSTAPPTESSTTIPTAKTTTEDEWLVRIEGGYMVRLSDDYDTEGLAVVELFDNKLLLTAGGISFDSYPPPDGPLTHLATFTISDLTGQTAPYVVGPLAAGQQVGYGPGCDYLLTIRRTDTFWLELQVVEFPPSANPQQFVCGPEA